MTPEEQAAADAKAAEEAAAAEATAAAEAEAAAKEEEARKAAAAADPDKTPLVMPRKAFNARLESERKRGATEAQAALDKDAQELGYKDHASMLQHLKAAKKQGGGKSAEDAAAEEEKRQEAAKRAEEERKRAAAAGGSKQDWKLRKQLEEEKKIRQRKERELRVEKERNEALVARHTLELRFVQAGVRKPKYVMSLLEEHMANMTPEQAEQFDDTKWLEELKKEEPMVFGEKSVTALDTTGAGGGTGAGEPPPKPKVGADGKPLYKDMLEVDPRTGKFKMSAREVDQEVRKIVSDAAKNPQTPVLEP
jgi:hypothetical protein